MILAASPEARAALVSAIKALTREKIAEEAYDPFVNMIQNVNVSLRKADFPVERHFRKYAPSVLGREGLLDLWIASIALSSFAMGIASNNIEPEDVEKAKRKPCDEYPKCIPMMLDRFLSALQSLEKAIS